MSRIPYRDTWTHVDGMTEREYRIRYQAHQEPVVRSPWYHVCEAVVFVACIAVLGYAIFWWLP